MAGRRGRRGNQEGSVRVRRGKWVVRYYDEHGVQRQRVTEASSKREALNQLRTALDQVAVARGRGAITTVAQLCDFHRRERLALGKSATELDKRWKPLSRFFAATDVNGVTSTMIATYAELRATEKVCKSTINRELAQLRHLLRVGLRTTPPIVRWDRMPRIELADESDRVRAVYIDDETWDQLRPQLAEHLQPLFTLAYWIGWRRGEILGLQRSQVDLKAGTVRLYPGRTKNKDGRLVYLPPEALAVLREQERRTKALERKQQRLIPWVFHYRGERIGSYYTGWAAALRRAGFEKGSLTPHDFRRTAARAYRRAGVTEQVAMKITGHKTPSIFRRYNITDEMDLAEAARLVAAKQLARRKDRARTKGE